MERIDGPQNRRSRRTRAAVLEAAWQLLEESGAEQTTMGAVAKRAGVSRQALYLHFSSRAELLLALHEYVDEKLDLASSLQPVLDAPDAEAALDAFCAHLAHYHPKIMAVDLAVLRAQGDDPDVAVLVDQGVEIWHEACRSIVQRLADERRLADPWTIATATDLLWSFMFPETLQRLTNSRGWSLDRYRELLTVLLRRTLVAARGPDVEPNGPS
ncbi:TetR/AcrR family transcriptional regulator [Phytoactinopolyspora mesophila]|uniref:TetR family transcriptional regulator n=1 Tax=Phytoactinopolyspora mesophila TaxID=2650750 RepID=A0A7K3MCV9_9ACTN|nr:TetR/AcrR family transcriptional regulator [Phytoactinopolyspora mesophila]NDL61133.1 TetR family transcriptional regulator [Phytoactinopolyspora mesophila]